MKKNKKKIKKKNSKNYSKKFLQKLSIYLHKKKNYDSITT